MITKFKNRKIDIVDIYVDAKVTGTNVKDYDSFIESAYWCYTGDELTVQELEELNDDIGIVFDAVMYKLDR